MTAVRLTTGGYARSPLVKSITLEVVADEELLPDFDLPFEPTTIVDGEFAEGTKWYSLVIDTGQNLAIHSQQSNYGSEKGWIIFDVNHDKKFPKNSTTYEPTNDHLWCFVGGYSKGYKIYNRAYGTSMVLGCESTLTGTNGLGTKILLVSPDAENYATEWNVDTKENDTYYVYRQDSKDATNKSDLNRWNSDDHRLTILTGRPASGGAIRFVECTNLPTENPTVTLPFDPTTVDNGEFASNTKWYYMKIKGAYIIDNSAANGGAIKPNGTNPNGAANSLWCVEQTTDNTFRFYNYEAGTSKVLVGPDSDSSDAVIVLKDLNSSGVTAWEVKPHDQGGTKYLVKKPGSNNLYWNKRDSDRNNKLSYWDTASSTDDTGSAVEFIEYTGELPSLVPLEEVTMEFNNWYQGNWGDDKWHPYWQSTIDADNGRPVYFRIEGTGDVVGMSKNYFYLHNGQTSTLSCDPRYYIESIEMDIVKSDGNSSITLSNGASVVSESIAGDKTVKMEGGLMWQPIRTMTIGSSNIRVTKIKVHLVPKAGQEFVPDADTWYRLNVVGGGSNRRGRSWEVYHNGYEPAPATAANATGGTGRLLTNEAAAPFNDYQLFKFIAGSDGKYAIQSKGNGKYLSDSGKDSEQAASRFDFSSEIPVYAYYIYSTQTEGNDLTKACLYLTDPNAAGDPKFLNCAADGQGYAVDYFTNVTNADNAHYFTFTPMEENRMALISSTSNFLTGADYDTANGSYFNNLTTKVTESSPVKMKFTSEGAMGYSSKDNNTRRIIMFNKNKTATLVPVDAPEGYYVTKLTFDVSPHSTGATSFTINGVSVDIPAGVDNHHIVSLTSTPTAPQSWTIASGNGEFFIWNMTVEFSRPFSAQLRAEQMADRIRNLGKLTALGFTQAEANSRANALKAHDFGESSSEEVIAYCNKAFTDYLATAKYEGEDASAAPLFHLNNASFDGSLALDPADNTPTLFEAMSAPALWTPTKNADDGSIKLYNPYAKRWLAVSEVGAYSAVENEADATWLFLGGSSQENLAILTLSAENTNSAVTAATASTLSLTAAGTDISGTDHWTLKRLSSDKDISDVMKATEALVLAGLAKYEKVPAIWSKEDLDAVKKAINDVDVPSGADLGNLIDKVKEYEAGLNTAENEAYTKALNVNFYLTQKTAPTSGSRIISVNADNALVRVDGLDNNSLFTFADEKEGKVRIAHKNAAGENCYVTRNGNGYGLTPADAIADDKGWFEIVVEPQGNTGAYGENEIALLDPQGGFINRNGKDGFGLQSYGSDDDGSRWYVTAMTNATLSADIEAARQSALSALSDMERVPFFWTADDVAAARAEVNALKVPAGNFSAEEILQKVVEATAAFNASVAKAAATAVGKAFAAHNATGERSGYLSTNKAGAGDENDTYLTQQKEISGDTEKWTLTEADKTVPTFYITHSDAQGNVDYIGPNPGSNNTPWRIKSTQEEAGQFKVVPAGANGKVGFMAYPAADESVAYLHRWDVAQTNRIVRWSQSADMSQWTVMGLEPEALDAQRTADISEANDQLEKMRRLTAIWASEDIDAAQAKLLDEIPAIADNADEALESYIAAKEAIDKVIAELNETITDRTLYFTNVSNAGIIAVGDAQGDNQGKLYRQRTSGLVNANFFRLVPSGTGFKLFNEASGRYIAGLPGGDNQQWGTADNEANAGVIYFDPTFCSGTNVTGLSTTSSPGANGHYYLHANAGDPVRWGGDNDPSRWIVAAASETQIAAAKYIAWLEDAKDATPWGAYALADGITAIQNTMANGGALASVESAYAEAVRRAEQSIASSGQDAEVVISHVPSGKLLTVGSDNTLVKNADGRTDEDKRNGKYGETQRWKLVAVPETSNRFHILSSQSDENGERNRYVSSFSTSEEGDVVGATTTADERLAAVIALHEGHLVFADGDEPKGRADDDQAAEKDHWIIGLYQPNTMKPEVSGFNETKLYYIRNVAKMRESEANKQRQYLTAGGSASGSDLRLFKEPQAASLWYITETGLPGQYYIRNAYYPDLIIKHPNKVTTDEADASTRLFINESRFTDSKKDVGLYISTTAEMTEGSGSCLDRGSFNSDKNATFDGLSGGYAPKANDYLGTAWVFTPVSENEEVDFFNRTQKTGYQASMAMIEYLRQTNPWCHDAFDRAAGNIGATMSPNGSFGESLKQLDEQSALNDLKDDFAAMLADELPGKTFIIHSLARLNAIPDVPTGRVGVNENGAVAMAPGVTDDTDAFTFMPSEKDGYFYLYNGEGKFMGASGSRTLVDDIDDAGRYTLELHFELSGGVPTNYWTAIKQDNGKYLKMAATGTGDAELIGDRANANSTEAGFEFTLFTPSPTGIEDVTPDAPETIGTLSGEVYDLQGRRVKGALTPGFYIISGRKVLVK
ncbi:MAG: hypothetical protein NC484_07880 [Alloprevotella sp.]|nr:hypothetical protein [Alloprevotella sp.]